jgi:hypothetical protein
MNSMKQYHFRGCSVGIADGSDFLSTPLRWPQIYIPSFMKTGSGIQVILRLLPQQFDGLQCWCYWLGGIYEVCHWDDPRRHDIHTKFHDYHCRNSGYYLKNLRGCKSWYYWWERFTKYRAEVTLGGVMYIWCFFTIGFRHSNNIKGITSTVWEAVVLALLKKGVY